MKKDYLLVVFKKPYKFEENTVKELDLNGLSNLKAIDLMRCQDEISKKGKYDAVLETDMEYCMLVASKATNKPIEFFNNLPASDATNIKNRVSSFLLGAV